VGVTLSIEDLQVIYRTPNGVIPAVRGVSLSLSEGEVLGIVGESGSGKSTLVFAIAGLLPKNAVVRARKFLILNYDVLKSPNVFHKLRGSGVFMIFQDPFSSLNPLMRIRDQLAEAYVTKVRQTKGVKIGINDVDDKELVEYLKRVNIPDPQIILYRYPHQLSGGQIQRIMIAMALILEPRILLADEPTTALDVITQAQVLHELRRLVDEIRTSMIFITHDIALASAMSDRLAVMYGGLLMEVGNTESVIMEPLHPYTQGLIASIPSKSKYEGLLNEIKGFYVPTDLNGCPFAPRCPYAKDICVKSLPELRMVNNRLVRCHLYG
jgi:peptide/nickel transport system ATP-binding protein